MSFFFHNGCRVKIDSLVRVLIDLYQQEAMESAITALQADDSYQDGCLVGANYRQCRSSHLGNQRRVK